MRSTTTIGETFGAVTGLLLAPLAGLGALLRRAPALHPAGTVCAAEVVPAAQSGPLGALATRLAGGALVRLSGSLWKHLRAPELLGCAVRFRGARPLEAREAPEDQDLLMATARRVFSIPRDMLATQRDDYLENMYYGLGEFEVEGCGRAELRLVPWGAAPEVEGDREAKLIAAVSTGRAGLWLELRRCASGAAWEPVCAIHLRSVLELEQAELRFSPLHTGLGLRPRGALHTMRVAPYRASQLVRSLVERR